MVLGKIPWFYFLGATAVLPLTLRMPIAEPIFVFFEIKVFGKG